MRTKPSSACLVIARPLARKGKTPVRISPCAAFAASGERPTATISGSVKQIAGIARWSKARFSPAMISATISPCAMARWASIGSPVTSPTAQTLRIEVAHRSSTRIKGPAIARSSVSRPKPTVRARRPTATKTFSAATRRLDAIGACEPRARPWRSRAPWRRAWSRCRARRISARPAGSAPRRRAAGSSAAPRRSSPWRRAWRRPCRAPCRYSPRRRRRASPEPWSAPAPRSRTGRPRRRTAARQAASAPEPVAMTRCSHAIRWSPVSACAIALLPSTIVARPFKDRTPAFLSSAPTPVASRATIPSFQAIVLAKSSVGAPRVRPIAFRASGSVSACAASAAWMMRFRGDAADMQAGAAELSVLDQHRVEAELAGADRRDIAAGAAADDENLAAKLVHPVLVICASCPHRVSSAASPSPAAGRRGRCVALAREAGGRRPRPTGEGTFLLDSNYQSSMKSAAGASTSARTRWMKVAPSWPSTTR